MRVARVGVALTTSATDPSAWSMPPEQEEAFRPTAATAASWTGAGSVPVRAPETRAREVPRAAEPPPADDERPAVGPERLLPPAASSAMEDDHNHQPDAGSSAAPSEPALAVLRRGARAAASSSQGCTTAA